MTREHDKSADLPLFHLALKPRELLLLADDFQHADPITADQRDRWINQGWITHWTSDHEAIYYVATSEWPN